jgi:hypothetical protein
VFPSDKHHTGLADNRVGELFLLSDCVGGVQRQAQTGGEWNNRLIWTLAGFVAGCRIRVLQRRSRRVPDSGVLGTTERRAKRQ